MKIVFNSERSQGYSMPGYLRNAMQRSTPNSYSLHTGQPPPLVCTTRPSTEAKKLQIVKTDKLAPLSPALKLEIQAIVGTLLHYARAVDPSLLTTASELGSQQANPTENVLKATNRPMPKLLCRHHGQRRHLLQSPSAT
jgi:hypothetical protein